MSTVLGVLILVVGVPLNIYVFLKLRELSTNAPGVRVLRERAHLAFVILLVVLVFGLIFVNNDLIQPVVTGEATKLITRLAVMVLAVVPACYWWWTYR